MPNNNVAIISLMAKFDEKSIEDAAKKLGKTTEEALSNVGQDKFGQGIVDEFNAAMETIKKKLKGVNLSSYTNNVLDSLFSDKDIKEKTKDLQKFIDNISNLSKSLSGLNPNSFNSMNTKQLDAVISKQEKILAKEQEIAKKREQLEGAAKNVSKQKRTVSTISKNYLMSDFEKSSESLKKLFNTENGFDKAQEKSIDNLSKMLTLYSDMEKIEPKKGTTEAIKYSTDLLTVVKEIKETANKIDLFTGGKASKFISDNFDSVNKVSEYNVKLSQQEYVKNELKSLNAQKSKLEKSLTDYIADTIHKNLQKISNETELVIDKATQKTDKLQQKIDSLKGDTKSGKPIITNIVDETQLKSLEDIEDRLYEIYDKDSDGEATNQELKEFIQLYKQYSVLVSKDNTVKSDPELQTEYEYILKSSNSLQKYSNQLDEIIAKKKESSDINLLNSDKTNTTTQFSKQKEEIKETIEAEQGLSDIQKTNSNIAISVDAKQALEDISAVKEGLESIPNEKKISISVGNTDYSSIPLLSDEEGNVVTAFRGVTNAWSGLINQDGIGFFTDKLKLAADYADSLAESGKVFQANLSFHNPLEIEGNGAKWNEIDFDGVKHTTDEIIQIAKNLGYDGVIFKNIRDGFSDTEEDISNVMVALNAAQIKNEHVVGAVKAGTGELTKIESELKKTQVQAENTAQAIKETTSVSQESNISSNDSDLQNTISALERLANWNNGDSLSLGKVMTKLYEGAKLANPEVQEILKTLRMIDDEGKLIGTHINEGTLNTGVDINDKYAIISRTTAIEDVDKLIAKEKEAEQQGILLAKTLASVDVGKFHYDIQEIAQGNSVHQMKNTSIEKFMKETQILCNATDEQILKLYNDAEKLSNLGFKLDLNPSNLRYDKNSGFSFIDLELRKINEDAPQSIQILHTLNQSLMGFMGQRNRLNWDDESSFYTKENLSYLQNMLQIFERLKSIFAEKLDTKTFNQGFLDSYDLIVSRISDIKHHFKELGIEVSSTTPEKDLKDAIQVDGSEVAATQKIADNFEEAKQNTDKATEAAKDYIRVLSQIGELGVDSKVSAMYERNDGQLESVSWRAKRDEQGQILYDKNGDIDYDISSTVISKYEQLEKIITTADNKVRDLEKSLKDVQNLNPNASTKNIEDQIQYQKDYIKLLEQTVKAISQQDEYLLYEQQIIDARAKAKKEYNLNQGTRSDISNAKQLASEEQKRQKNIEQTNRLLNRQQITIDTIEKSYNKIANPDLDKSVSDTSDLSELSKKKSEIQNLINQLNGQSRNSSNEQEFLQLEKLISEYKQLAKDKLKANNPSKQELGGQDLTVLLEQQVAQYNQLIAKAEKYGDATSDIVDKLKTQRDLIAQANSDGVYTAKSGLKADDYYSARDNYKIGKAQFSSYETDIKNTEKLIQAQKELGEVTTKARQAAKNSTQSSVDNALKEQVSAWKNIQSIREKITKTKDTDEIANLQQIKKEYQQNYIEADKILKANSSLYDKEIQVAKLEQIRVETNKKIADYNGKQVSGFDKRISGYEDKLTNYQATAKKFEGGGWTSDTYKEQIEKLNNAIREYKSLLDSMQHDSGLVTDDNIEKLNKFESKIKQVISTVSNMSAAEKGFTKLDGQKTMNWISQQLRDNSKMSREAKNQIKAYYAQIESGNPTMSLAKIRAEVLEIVNAEEQAGRAGKSMFDTIKEKAWYGFAGAIGTYFGINDIFRYVGQGVQTVRELDTALTEMRKVSDESTQSLKNYQATTFDVADAVGTTAKQIQNSTADWMRLGESMDQAAKSAKDATILLNVSEFEGIDEATDALVSMSQAYKDLDKMDIIDVLNNVGNNYSISTDGLATALKDSASALVTANNDLNEAVALTTAGNAITQDPSKVGAGLRTISLRLVGTEQAKQELSDLGEETDGMITTVSKLRDTIMDATKAASKDGKGFDILDSNGNYKSTYSIMQGLADLYDDIVKKDKELGTNNLNLILETIAGKNRSNIAASILQNGDMLRSVYEDAQNSEGSAEQELQKYLDSIDGKIAQLQNRVQEFWTKVIDSEVIKNGIDLLTTLVKGATDFVDAIGVLPTLLTGIGAALSFKNVGGSKMYDLILF